MRNGLPPLPEPYQEALTPFWAYTTYQMQAYATQARADLEAENQRLREALVKAAEYVETLGGVGTLIRTTLENQP